MDIWEQFEIALEETRCRAIWEKLMENFNKFSFYPVHIERREDDDLWTNHLCALGPEGEIIRNLNIQLQSPDPLIFNMHYPFNFISCFPYWVSYRHEGQTFRYRSDPIST
jgi:hypothetical protein